MNEKIPIRTSNNWCKYCGCNLSTDSIQKISEHNTVICESCGTEVKKYDIIFESETNELNSHEIRNRNKSKFYSYLKRIYKTIRNEKGPIAKILDDSDLPLVFKENLMIVVSRFIYYHLKILEQDLIFSPNNAEISKDLLDRIYNEINPILSKRIKRKFLDNLFNITIKRFEKFLQILQKKIKVHDKFRQNFIIFLHWLINKVYTITTKLWSQENLPRFERFIRDDLRSCPIVFVPTTKNSSNNQNLINDKHNQMKECTRCHQTMPYDRFNPVTKGSEEVRANCKRCNSELSLIRQNRKKLNIIILKYNGKCSECGIDDSILPVFQFHHQDPNIKSISWRDIKNRSYSYINNKFEIENIVVLCSNCHSKKQALVFNKYSNLILQQNLILQTPEEINSSILNSTKNILKKVDRMHLRAKIREWIKKRYIIEQLYEGRCVGCREVSVENNLTALEFHHYDGEVENKLKWESLETLDTTLIAEQLINQKCLCLCSNCHSLIHSRFNEFAVEILNKFYNQDLLKQKVEEIESNFRKIFNNISSFEIKHNTLRSKPLLKLSIPHTDNWIIHLLKIYYFSRKFENKIFKAYDLENILNISIRHIYKHLNRFKKEGYIENSKLLRGKFIFTDSGLNKVKELESDHRSLANKIRINLNYENL
ncbi:MAG: hypothetical protein ACXABO_03480 [Promethearchaeota archaeon]|jgi:Zn finger protein HypA/HybF involved in hydrogenase expression